MEAQPPTTHTQVGAHTPVLACCRASRRVRFSPRGSVFVRGTRPTRDLLSPARAPAMATTVDALLPLSFLEAVRAADRPDEDPDAEFVAELRNKRLGLSETVQAQIRRYTEAQRRHQRTGADEVGALARLIGRRPDAEIVFRSAGQWWAEGAYAALPRTTRRVVRTLPGVVARPLALRQVRRLARRYFGGTVRRVGGSLLLEVPAPLTASSTASPTGPAAAGATASHAGCAYYETGFRELLRLLVAAGGRVEHVRCAARGEGSCQWRADWRS